MTQVKKKMMLLEGKYTGAGNYGRQIMAFLTLTTMPPFILSETSALILVLA